jgi:hypothetical protein
VPKRYSFVDLSKANAVARHLCQLAGFVCLLILGPTLVGWGQGWPPTSGTSPAPHPANNPTPVEGWPSLGDPAPPPNAPLASPMTPPGRDLHGGTLAGRPDRTAALDTSMPQIERSVFEPAETVGLVGDQHIFRGDLIGDVRLLQTTMIEKIPEEQREQYRPQIEAQGERLFDQLLQQTVDRKLMYLEFLRSIPPDKLGEVQTNIESKIGPAFEEDLLDALEKIQRAASEDEYGEVARKDSQIFRLALIMKEKKLASVLELDLLLRQNGSSVAKQQRAYAERKLGQQQMVKSVKFQPDITHHEMLDYYRENQEEFRVPTRARWEQLSAHFDSCPDEKACTDLIAMMGNEVVLGGAPFWAVAQRHSHGENAPQGGFHNWADQGDLRISPEINDAVFTLPVQQMSGIIRDSEGLHIIRVIERSEEHVVPFIDAQVEIKKRLLVKKRNASIDEYVARLRASTPVWTINDEDSTQP